MQTTILTRAATVLAAGTLLAGTAAAQLRGDAAPAAVTGGLDPQMVPVVFLEPPDVATYLAEDEARGHRPLRYGALLSTDVGVDDDLGVWDRLEDGTLVWRCKIYSPGAKTLGLEFDDFELPEGAYCFMYDEDLRTFYGSYGAVNNQPNQELLFEPFPGDMVVFEYVQPPGVEGEPLLNLGTVVYDYRGVDDIDLDQFQVSGEEGGAAPPPGAGCDFIDVNCPEGDPWDLQKRAVVRTLSGGSLCSGALINNTNNDGTQYVLTADHCAQDANTVFRFNYEKANCGSGGAPTGQNISGATVLATTAGFDSRLLEINSSIPSNWDPYFAGWSRSTTNPSTAFTMGHPNGGPKKITIDQNGATKGIIGPPSSAWFVDWSDGYIDGGSSGGPLFDQNGRVRGSACCVNFFSCQGQQAWFGRFDRFYNTQNLAQWLDPAGTNPTNLDGYDPNAPVNPNVTVSSVNPPIIEAVRVDAPTSVTLNGTGFTSLSKVEVDGEELVGFAWTVQNDTQMSIQVGHLSRLGNVAIDLTDTNGVTTTTGIGVVPNTSLTIDLEQSDPSFLVQGAGVRVYTGAPLSHYVWLTFALNNTPSVLPGVVSLGLGNNFVQLFTLQEGGVNPSNGYLLLESGPLSGYPIGTKVYFQAASIDLFAPAFPLFTSNLESGTFLF